MPPETTQPDLFSVFADMPYRDADAFDVLHRDNEAEDPQHLPQKSPAEALEAIYNRNLDLAAEGIDIEALAPDLALRHARADQADFMRLGEREKIEAVPVIADNFRNRSYSAEFARNNPEAAQYVVLQDKQLNQPTNSPQGLDNPGAAWDAAALANMEASRARFIEMGIRGNPNSTDEERWRAKEDRKLAEFAQTSPVAPTISEANLSPADTPTTTKNATTPSAQKREIMAELKELDSSANPGYSPLKSWENLRAVARKEGLTAAIWRGTGEDSAPYVITYTDAQGQPTSIKSEMHQDGKAVTTLAGERVPGTGPTSDTVWQRDALNTAIAGHRIESIRKETEQIHATPGFRIMEARRGEEFQQADALLTKNAADALKIRMVQDSKGQHNVAIQNGDDIRTFFSNSSIHAANQVLKNLRQDMTNKLFSMADFQVLPRLLARKSKASGKPVFDQEAPPINQICDDAPVRLEKDGRLTVNHEFDGKRVLKAHELPPHFHKKFIVSDDVPGKFYFPDSKKLAFSDHGGKLATDENKPEVIRSMIELAKEKNWSSITVSGADEFKREAWLQATLAGMEVKGYKPKPEDMALLDQTREQRMANRLYQSPGDRQPTPAVPQNEISTTPPAPALEESQGFKVPDDYKPSPDAMAVAEKMRVGGVPEDKMRLVMYGVDLSKQSALEKGIPDFQARIFDSKAAPQKAVSIAVEQPAAPEATPQDIAQPSPSPRR